MKYGFSFKGIHTKEITGLTVKTASRPIKADMRDTVFTVPFMDGSISTAVNNPYRREFYEARRFTMTMMLTAEDFTGLNKKLAKISSWLTGRGELIFDDTPLIVWDATAAGSVDYMPERAGRKAVLSVSFEVQPFGRLAWGVNECPAIGQDGIYLGDNIPIGLGEANTVTLTESDTSKSFTVINYGDRYVRPIVTMKSVSNGPSAYVGSITVTVNGDEENSMMTGPGREVKTVIVNCEKHTVTDDDGKNILGRSAIDETWFSGRFIELPPGKNTLSLFRSAHEGAGDAEVTVDFTPAYMWDADFDMTDWG